VLFTHLEMTGFDAESVPGVELSPCTALLPLSPQECHRSALNTTSIANPNCQLGRAEIRAQASRRPEESWQSSYLWNTGNPPVAAYEYAALRCNSQSAITHP
jgi:hypothetical protein